MNRYLMILSSLGATAAVPASAAVVAAQSFEVPVQTLSQITYGPDEIPYDSQPGAPAAAVSGIVFHGFSGVAVNSSNYPVFSDAPDGTQAAFLQSINGGGSEIDWFVAGLTIGDEYTLSFKASSALIAPVEPINIQILGGRITSYTPPSTSYTKKTISFVAGVSSGTISFSGPVLTGNHGTGIDALSVATVPEPASWALLVAGFGLVGAVSRRQVAARA